MKTPTRLGGVLRLREQARQEAERGLAEADARRRAAHAVLDEAREALLHDARGTGCAALWAAGELAARQALRRVHALERDADEAEEARQQAEDGFRVAYGRHEAVRRLVEQRHATVQRETARREQLRLDELGALRYVLRED